VADRAILDAELCRDVANLEGKGDARITAAAKEIAARLDVQAVVDRAAKAVADGTVTIRPAPDCMTYVTVLLPVAQGVGVYAALKHAADTTFDDRSRGQVMADQGLWGQDNAPAVLEGYGPIPASLAQQLVTDAVVDERSVTSLRRLYRHPNSGAVGGDAVAVAVVSQGVGAVHRRAGPHVSHPVL
jgi:hypothetical protein